MSKFIDALTHAAQAGPQPMGFTAIRQAPERRRIQLVALVADGIVANAEIGGADAVLFRSADIASGAKELRKASKDSSIPWGIWPTDTGADAAKGLSASDADFAVLAASDNAVLVSPDEEIGIIIQLGVEIADGLLRTIDDLPVDAALITVDAEAPSPLAWRQLMVLQRFANLIAKPLLLLIPAGVTADEVQMYWEAGIEAVVAAADGDHAGEIARLRELIDGLEAPTHRKRPKMEPLLPRAGRDTEPLEEFEEQDDD